MPYEIDTAPTSEPVTTAEAKTWARITTAEDDFNIDFKIKAAREYVETYSGRALLGQTWDLVLDRFPKEILLRKPPVTSVTSIEYTDVNGVTGTALASTEYQTDFVSEPARIREAYSKSWPSTRAEMNAVTIKFVSGYANKALVPESLKQAIKELVSFWYYNREAVIVGLEFRELPFGVQALIKQYEVAQI